MFCQSICFKAPWLVLIISFVNKKVWTIYAYLPFDFVTAFLSLAGSDTVSFTVWLNSCQTCQTCALDCISSPEVQLHVAAGHPAVLCLGLHQLTRSTAAYALRTPLSNMYLKTNCIIVQDTPVKQMPLTASAHQNYSWMSPGHSCQTCAMDCIS